MPEQTWTHPVTGEEFADLTDRERSMLDVIERLERAVDGLEDRGVECENQLRRAEDVLVEIGDLPNAPERQHAANEQSRRGIPHFVDWRSVAHEQSRRARSVLAEIRGGAGR